MSDFNKAVDAKYQNEERVRKAYLQPFREEVLEWLGDWADYPFEQFEDLARLFDIEWNEKEEKWELIDLTKTNQK